MSMVALAARLCLTQALLGKTLAGGNVYDSNVVALEDFVRENPAPFVTVATDEQSAIYDGMSYAAANREMALVLEMGLGKAVKIPVKVGEPEEYLFETSHTDEGLELIVDIMGRQIMRVMQTDTGVWADLFRIFAGHPGKSTAKRGAAAESGIRFAARQIIITFGSPMAEPNFGEVPSEGLPWARLIAALRASSPELIKIGDLIEEAIVGDVIPDWARLQADLGLSTDAMAAVGLGPLPPGPLPGEPLTDIEKLETDGDHLATVAVPEEEP